MISKRIRSVFIDKNKIKKSVEMLESGSSEGGKEGRREGAVNGNCINSHCDNDLGLWSEANDKPFSFYIIW